MMRESDKTVRRRVSMYNDKSPINLTSITAIGLSKNRPNVLMCGTVYISPLNEYGYTYTPGLLYTHTLAIAAYR